MEWFKRYDNYNKYQKNIDAFRLLQGQNSNHMFDKFLVLTIFNEEAYLTFKSIFHKALSFFGLLSR